MIFEVVNNLNELIPLPHKNISAKFKKNEKNLEIFLSKMIGNEIFPQYLSFGNERQWQSEADIFAVNDVGDLIIFELKVHGHDDKGKIYQALGYAQAFSKWTYNNMNEHYKKCGGDGELIDAFEEHFGQAIDQSDFNKKQKTIVISNSSSISTNSVTEYWKRQGISIEEYFYRFYNVAGKNIVEISSELYIPESGGNCWINTCKKYDKNAYLDMVTNSKASAYGDRKRVIHRGLSNSTVFLYHNGYGIIGGGVGTAKLSDNGDEKQIKLKNFIHGVNLKTGQIKNCLGARKIKALLKQDFYFPNSIVSLSNKNAKILYDECKKLFK